MYGLQNELWGVETFVFSTSLSRITHLIRTKDIVNALEKISGSILGWSGGTNIGRSLHTFNRSFAPSMVTHRTVVVIISDGWDRGDVSLLEREMQDLKRRCQENHLAQSASGERKLRTALQRHAGGAAVSGHVFVGAQRQ